MFHRKTKTSKLTTLLTAVAALKGGKHLASMTAAGVGGYVLYRWLR